MARVLCLFLLLEILGFTYAQNEMLSNPDFEGSFDGNWQCLNCVVTRSTDAYTGQYSAQVTERSANWAGLTQYVNLQGGNKYYFRSMVKMLNQLPGYQWHKIDAMMEIDFEDGEKYYQPIGITAHAQVVHGWQIHGGDVTMKNKEIRRARVYIQIDQPGANYVMDTATLTEIIPNANWLNEANARIEQLRKADIKFKVSIGASYNPTDIELDVELRRHAVTFGSAVSADRIVATDDSSKAYQKFFFDNFEHGVLENALKWNDMEPNQGYINFERPGNAIDKLLENGVPVRGHCVYWEVEKWMPDWLRAMSGEQVRAQITRRAEYVVNAFKGKLVHWDVNNEDLHGEFFKSKTGDPNIIQTMFREVQQHDPDVKLFLNEYGVANTHIDTHAYLNQAIRVKDSGAPVYGVGIQSHIEGYVDPDILKKRMDVMSEAGLPIWITELDYPNKDRNARADGYEVALRLYYSHPNIEGIMLWGFWDQRHWKPDAALAEGESVTINAAGLRFQQLVKNEWNTSATLRPTSSNDELSLRGFQGQYNINIKDKGQIIKTMTFDIPNKVTSYQVQVNV